MQGFWRRWCTEYIRTLRVRSMWNVVTKDAVINVGDLVLVVEDKSTIINLTHWPGDTAPSWLQ